MSSKYKQHNVLKIKTYKQCHQNTKSRKQVLILLLVLVLLMLMLPPPRPLASPPTQYRRDLLPNMAHGLKPLFRAHDLHLAHLRINVGNHATNHVIGIRRASRLEPLPLLSNDLLFICWPQKISSKRWQNQRVRHLWRWEKHKKGVLNCVCFFFVFSYWSHWSEADRVQLLKW